MKMVIISKEDCYPDFLVRLYNNTDECFKLIRTGRTTIEVQWRL